MFRAMTSESVTELVRRLRLEHATHRLRCESTAVTEVALDAGYDSAEAYKCLFTPWDAATHTFVACTFSPIVQSYMP